MFSHDMAQLRHAPSVSVRRLMAAQLAQQATKTAPVMPGIRPIVIPTQLYRRPSYNPMGNFWRTAMMANMLSGDGMVLFD